MRPEKIEDICTQLKPVIKADRLVGKNFGSAHGVMFMASWLGHSKTVFVNDYEVWGDSVESIVAGLVEKF